MIDKQVEEKEIKDLNQVGKRIKWCRETLGLSMYRVAKDNGLNQSTYCNREDGMRAICHEEYLVLANYFNELWGKKFENSYALYMGTKINRIKVSWLLYGIFEE